MNKTKELQNQLEQLHAELAKIKADITKIPLLDARATCCVAEILSVSSRLAEITTGRIVRLTWALCLLTFGLLGATAILIYQNAHTEAKSDGPAQHAPTK